MLQVKMATTSDTTDILNDLNLDDIDPLTCTEPDNDKPWLQQCYLPIVDRDIMVISSYGNHPQNTGCVARKLIPATTSTTTTTRTELAWEELDCVLDWYREDTNAFLVYCYNDQGQMSRQYYLERIKKFLKECKNESGMKSQSLILMLLIELYLLSYSPLVLYWRQ